MYIYIYISLYLVRRVLHGVQCELVSVIIYVCQPSQKKTLFKDPDQYTLLVYHR